jgi:3-dehydroquinate synthase
VIDPANSVYVDLGTRSYQIAIGTGTLGQLGQFASEHCPASHAVVITDDNVERPHAMAVAESLRDAKMETDLIVIPAGEPSKSIDTATRIWLKCLEVGATRKSIILAVGGGVIGDLAGFIAASYSRGLRFLQVPTTLLAQVDSSVGGKVGVNLPGAKNMVGAFWQPSAVLADTATLETLPAREYRAGLAEVVKYGVILDAEFFQYLEQRTDDLNRRDPEVLIDVIQRSCQLKANVVQEDEREETGYRAILNYGHTFAHAFEAVTEFRELLHGEAVAIGMLCASRLAEQLGRVEPEFTSRQAKLLKDLGLPTNIPSCDPEELLTAIRRDKKMESGGLRFVLPTMMGHVELVDDVGAEDVFSILQGGRIE